MAANTKRNRTEAKIILCVLLICILAAGGYFAHMFGWFAKGNGRAYSVQEAQPLEDRPLAGKAILFLGSSVTKGYAAKGESFVDFLRKQDGIGAIKEAVSGTTLVDNGGNSYIARLKRIAPSMSFDMLICQLSTNDATKHMPLGKIADTYDMNDFRTSTVAGAIEYIIAYTKETWGCPVVFYTGTYYESEEYKAMVDLLYAVQEKWGIGILDLYNDADMRSVSDEDRALYMVDDIHPSRAGYKLWWTPKFREYLLQYDW